MSLLAMGSLVVYVSWRVLNAYQSYLYNEKITLGNMWEIAFTIVMAYWLVLPSSLFLIAKVFDGLFALGLGIYLNMQVGPDKFLVMRDKVVNGYWGYAITDASICVACFFMSMMGSING